jgi:UDP-galactopyranose mutase
MERHEYLIVGSGLTGAVIGRMLADAGRDVLIVDRRAHVGGNVYDHVHPSGVRIHAYGPHYFRTNSEKIWTFVTRFASFYRYEASLKSYVDGRYENWPIAASYIRRTVGTDWRPAFVGVPQNFEEASLAMMPRLIYEKFVKGYTEKQWGVPAASLAAELAGRFDVREDDEPRLKRHKHQGIPVGGYHAFMQSLLDAIPIKLNCDYLKERQRLGAGRCVVFTGPIDQYFEFDLGRLAYRGQQREHIHHPGLDYFQPCGQVNNPDPDNGPYIRTLEWKYMMAADELAAVRGTLTTRETPITPTDPDGYEYPFPDDANQRLYGRYRERADAIEGLLVCGRLGEYRYYDMDQAIGRAMVLARRLLA